MAQGKSGTRTQPKDRNSALDLPKRGAPKASQTEAQKKAALLARMKAAAEAKSKG